MDQFSVLDQPLLVRTSSTQLATDADDSLLVYGNVGVGSLLLLGADGVLARVATDTLGTPNSLRFTESGAGLEVTESGTAARMGTVALNGATEVTVSTTAVTAASRILLSVQAPGGVPTGAAWISARSPGVSFGLTGLAGDTSTVAWLICEPA